jgi:integrase
MSSPRLARFFEDLFVPLQMRYARPGYVEIHRCSVRWFDRALGRAATTADLSRDNLAAALANLAAAGLGQVRLKEILKCWCRVWRYAAELKLAAAVDRPPLPQARGLVREWASSPPAEGTVLSFYQRTFRPQLARGARQQTVSSYDSAINYFHDFAGSQVPLDALSVARVKEFFAWLLARGISRRLAGEYATRMRRIGRGFDPDGFPAAGGPCPKRPIAAEARAPRKRSLPEPTGEPGTLVHFFQTIYRREALLTHEGSCPNYFSTLRYVRACFGRDVTLAELSAAIVSQFCAWLTDHKGLSLAGMKAHRVRLMAMWRYANDQGLAPGVPRLRKLIVPREEPDAWSLEELIKLVAATDQLDKPPIVGIPAPDYWRALILVGYWTALRRGALLKIEPGHFELSGWLYVPARGMKNGRGKRFRLGEDAIAAVVKIAEPGRAFIFPKPSDGSRLAKHFRELVRLAGLPKSRHSRGLFHKLRRTSITHTAARAGMSAAIALAGHSSQYVTERYLDPTFLTGNDATQWLPSLTELARRG